MKVEHVQIAVDCADPGRLAMFWSEALGYQLVAPPGGYATWSDFARPSGADPDEWVGCPLIDPDSVGPRLLFHRVPEEKVVKNRIHLDVFVADNNPKADNTRRETVDAEVTRLAALGASIVRADDTDGDEYYVVMQDPEGNEFCVG